jgi:predicted ArsR family transcriptional regulator
VDPVGAARDELPPAASVDAVAALSDGLRRRLYRFIRHARRPVTREEAAAEVGISRKLAAFHLDKLVDVGLLRGHTESPSRPRKVGRAPKLYEPAEATVAMSIPARQHELLAEILVEAILTEPEHGAARRAALETARARGATLGAAARDRARPGRLGRERALTLAEQTLASLGFEPHRHSTTRVQLGNCPFHPLASQAPDLVCAINHAFLAGYLSGLDATGVAAVLAPEPGRCCVELTASQ